MKKLHAAALALMLLAPSLALAADEYYPVKTQVTTYSSVSTAITEGSAAQVDVLRIVCTTACYVALAATGYEDLVAVAGGATSVYLPANLPEYFRIGSSTSVVAIRVSTDGSLIVTEMSK
jgi:hypothetical protein